MPLKYGYFHVLWWILALSMITATQKRLNFQTCYLSIDVWSLHIEQWWWCIWHFKNFLATGVVQPGVEVHEQPLRSLLQLLLVGEWQHWVKKHCGKSSQTPQTKRLVDSRLAVPTLMHRFASTTLPCLMNMLIGIFKNTFFNALQP